ncbi:MAG: polyamine aminopropyltransferase [Chloroflexi bacterium]|nr:polyamine aminopropyltransferase [Chloroflexota bacterium]
MLPDRRKWYFELITPDLMQLASIRTVLYSGRTAYQSVEVLETGPYGRCLVLDGKTQSAEADEFIYHESLVQPALVAHPRPQRVLVAGGGEGATLREVLRHRCVRRVVMVDLDQEVVELCQKYLPGHHQGAFQDARLELHFGDAKAFLEQSRETFDVIVLDLPDPMEGGPAWQLYTQRFYRMVRDRLEPGGLLVTQSGPAGPLNYREVFTAIHNTLETVFPQVYPFFTYVQSFGEAWGFTIASLGPNPAELSPGQVDTRLGERGVAGLRFYDGLVHGGLFALPLFLRQALAAEERIITEEKPLFVF